MPPAQDSTTPLLLKIERYLEQRQALGGKLTYIEPIVPSAPMMPNAGTIITLSENHHEESVKKHQSQAETSIKTALQGNDATPTVNPAWRDAPSLPVLYENIHTCLNCKLGATRTKFVFGVGNPNADLLVIGEALGADEDAQGEPFVGRGGQLLTKILEAVNFSRDEVYIANIIKCRPPENRRPEADEVEQCEPYLYKQIELIQPKLMLALGLTAVNTLLKAKHTMGAIRGKTLEYRGIPLIATYHPAALLRNPEWKRSTWEDVQLVRKMYDNLTGKSS